jgi:hypothetical protein
MFVHLDGAVRAAVGPSPHLPLGLTGAELGLDAAVTKRLASTPLLSHDPPGGTSQRARAARTA